MRYCGVMKKMYVIVSLLMCVMVQVAFAKDKVDVHVNTDEKTFQKLETFSKVLSYIERNYIDDIDHTKLIDRAIKGMVSDLDPHSIYLTKQEYDQIKMDTSGKFGGIGIEMGLNEDKRVYVVRPLETGPAKDSGIKAGDLIVEVNGASTSGWSLMDAINKMRGPRGTSIKLKLSHEGEVDTFEVNLKRATFYERSVTSEVFFNEFGYIQIRSFQESTTKDVAKAFSKLRRKFKKKKTLMKGLILDLRNNPGGLLDQAVKVSDLFLDRGAIVSTKGRSADSVEIKYAKKEGTLAHMPMVVLINEGTASASEIVAGALQDHLRATLIGTRSFGKGSVQTIVDLDDGSGLKMTVARYYTPNDRPIQNVGNEPDIYVSYFNYRPGDDLVPREQDLEGNLDTVSLKKDKVSKQKAVVLSDAQLKASIEYLKDQNRKASPATPRKSQN